MTIRIRKNSKSTSRRTYRGKTRTLKDWSKRYGVQLLLLKQRINFGWPIGRALRTKPYTLHTNTVRAIHRAFQAGDTCQVVADKYGVCIATVRHIGNGWSRADVTGAR